MPHSAEQGLITGDGRGTLMLIEDNELEREILASTLEAFGFSVIACEDSRAALDRLHTAPTPRLILLDLHTPRMSGWEFRLEQCKHPVWREIPVIAMSGDRTPQAAAINADNFLSKPLKRSALFSAIEKALAGTTTKATREPKTRACGTGDSVREQDGPLGPLEGGVMPPLEVLTSSLVLARGLTQSLQRRVPSSEGFSVVGIAQLLSRAHKAAMHLRAVLHAQETQKGALGKEPNVNRGAFH